MKRAIPHLYFHDGMWHCRGAGQMLTVVGKSATAAYARWSSYCRLLESGRVL